jgi:mRNA interferase YafQ
MKYAVAQTSQFKRELKRAVRRGCDLAAIRDVVCQLAEGNSLPARHRDRALTGSFAGFRECHITPDWLLVYLIEGKTMTLTLTRTGSHSDLF